MLLRTARPTTGKPGEPLSEPSTHAQANRQAYHWKTGQATSAQQKRLGQTTGKPGANRRGGANCQRTGWLANRLANRMVGEPDGSLSKLNL